MNLEPKGGQKVFNFGTSVHAGMEGYYDPRSWGDTEIMQASALANFVHSEEQFRLAEGDNISFELQAEYAERMVLGTGMLKHYFTWAPEMDKDLTPVKVEVEFEVPVPCTPEQLEQLKAGPRWRSTGGELHYRTNAVATGADNWVPVVYQGRIDLLFQDKWGYYWIVDHKTAAQFGSVDYLDLDEQCGSYCWAMQKMLGLPIQGVIYNRLLKSVPKPPQELVRGGFSQNKQQKTTYAIYKKTLEENNEPYAPYADFLEYLKAQPNSFFARHQVHRNQTELQNLERQIVMEAIEMLDDPWIYPNPGMFNCMGCAYRIPCLAVNDGSDLTYIMENFKVREPSE